MARPNSSELLGPSREKSGQGINRVGRKGVQGINRVGKEGDRE